MAVAVLSALALVPATEAQAASLDWEPCEGSALNGLECATLTVPMDYRSPSGAHLSIALSRHQATDPKRRRGVLFTNPGGPGGAGLQLPIDYADQPIGQVYDIIGMDPRGVGRSTRLACLISSWRPDLPSRPSDTDLPVFTAVARDSEEQCQRGGGQLRQHITTMNTARDLDRARAALGERKINYLGVSYGTWLGAVYGEMFPQRLDRSVLDSALDPLKTWHEQDDDILTTIEANFTRWATWAANRNATFKLGTTPREVRASVDKVAEAVKAKPVAGFRDISLFDENVGVSTRYRPLWKEFGETMRQALDEIAGAEPDTASRGRIDRVVSAQRDDIKATRNGVFQTVTCEWDWPSNVEGYYADMRKARDHFPYGNTVSYMAPTNCTFRSFTPEPLPKIGRARYPLGLVLQSDGDTNTPYVNGEVMAETLGSALVSVAGEGTHGQYANVPDPITGFPAANPCVDDAVNTYLLDGVLPASRLTCQSTNPPPNVPFDAPAVAHRTTGAGA
ncbi:TAP-like protein [Amycolatopsis xylanica]|uniref:TAP-like protein n=1 Tax=Amycolatopsis xylanica TaxID=589385 RepID=A0A1H3NNW3_9PSEU|nr:TAP-like protein [Amycolatopsis xylanica]